MLDKNPFDPELIRMLEYKLLKCFVEASESFVSSLVSGHKLENTLILSFNLEEKMAKANLTLKIKSDSDGKNKKEASAEFEISFLYKVSNLDALVTKAKNQKLTVNPYLANALTSVSYSTSRGILLGQLQNTALHNFILPVINPNQLFHTQTK